LKGIEIKANPERHIIKEKLTWKAHNKRKANMEGTIIKEKLTWKAQ